MSNPAIELRVDAVYDAALNRKERARAEGRGIPKALSTVDSAFLSGLKQRRTLSEKQEKWLADLEARYHVTRVA